MLAYGKLVDFSGGRIDLMRVSPGEGSSGELTMSVELLTHYGLPGALAAAIVSLLYALIRRGLRVKFEAEIPSKRR